MLQVKRARKTTLHQYEIMLDFIESHPEMISGRLTDTFTAQRREELWADLSIVLNSLSYGPQKTPLKWRKTWIDIKCEAKQKEREIREQNQLRGNSKPLSMPLHLSRIKSLVALSNVANTKNMKKRDDQDIKENNCADQCSFKIKECFEEESSPDTDVLKNENLELDKKTNPAIKIENMSEDEVSTSETTSFENVYIIPSTSTESPFELNKTTNPPIKNKNVSDILSASETTSFKNVYNIPSTSTGSSFEKDILTTYDEIPCETLLDIPITSVESSCEQMPNIPSTSVKKSCEKNGDVPLICVKNLSENVSDTSALSSNTPSRKSSNDLSKSTKSSCEKVCDILTTSVKKLNDVITNSENRTILAFNALTKATVRANELQERHLLIEEERNKLYRERNEILFTLVNTFIEKRVNHQC